MLAGLTSQWTTPSAWALASARQSCSAIERARSGSSAAAAQALCEALAFDQLGDVVGTLLGVADVEDLHDPGVAHPREQPRLALEALHPRAVLGPPWLDHLHGDRPREALVQAAVYTPEGALADHRVKLVAPVEGPARQIRGAEHCPGVSREAVSRGAIRAPSRRRPAASPGRDRHSQAKWTLR